ncbi:hypothetical protein GCM10009119_04280 [Algoriphagus jejuensis]|uniref:Enamine deaminase RidA (YjgF/YER057c/UK114 family) n=1 Tax=Algoriphagus jejuensis TaxID=419934 RepID=A0ABN1MVX8_9BACT
MKDSFQLILLAYFGIAFLPSCQSAPVAPPPPPVEFDAPDYFLLRPELEKSYGYSHAVRIGNNLIISGAVSMDDAGNLIGHGDMALQIKNCYADLKKILDHYGFEVEDVVVENILTTNMEEFIKVSALRNEIYTQYFPTGSWIQVSGLALPGQLIEIEWEALKSHWRPQHTFKPKKHSTNKTT